MFDHRGSVISVGSRVAYNYSGEIAYGEVISVKEPIGSRVRDRAVITIKQLHPHYGNVSKVRAAKNVMVLFEEK